MLFSPQKCLTICGKSTNSNYVDLIDEVIIDDNRCHIYIGACQHSGLKPHYHILSREGQLTIDLEDEKHIDILQAENWPNLDETQEFLKYWLSDTNPNMDIFSNRDYLRLFWNVENPEMKLTHIGQYIPAKPIAKPILTATINTCGIHKNVKKFIFPLDDNELLDFKARYNIGDDFEGNKIISITIS